LYVVAIGKAAWRMAKAADDVLRLMISDRVIHGVVVTKYNHSEGDIENFEIYEAGHPVPDENTLIATKRVLELTNSLKEDDVVLFLIWRCIRPRRERWESMKNFYQTDVRRTWRCPSSYRNRLRRTDHF